MTTMWRFAILVTLLPIACGGVDAVAEMNAGLLELSNERPAAAIPHFEAALAATPDWHEARINYAVACFHAGVEDGAVLEAVLAERPDDPHALFLTGAKHRTAGDATCAVEAFERLSRIATDDPHVWCWLGLSLKDSGRVVEARAALVRAGDLRPAKVALAVLDGRRATDVSGRPIRGRYAYWSRYGRAIRRFPGVDREPGAGSNYLWIDVAPGSAPESMAGPMQGDECPGVEVRAGPCWFEGHWPLRVELGDRERVDFVRVVWPGGRITAHGPYDANQNIVIRESD